MRWESPKTTPHIPLETQRKEGTCRRSLSQFSAELGLELASLARGAFQLHPDGSRRHLFTSREGLVCPGLRSPGRIPQGGQCGGRGAEEQRTSSPGPSHPPFPQSPPLPPSPGTCSSIRSLVIRWKGSSRKDGKGSRSHFGRLCRRLSSAEKRTFVSLQKQDTSRPWPRTRLPSFLSHACMAPLSTSRTLT